MSHSLNTWGVTTTFLFPDFTALITEDKAWRQKEKKRKEESTASNNANRPMSRSGFAVLSTRQFGGLRSGDTKQCYLRTCVVCWGPFPWMLQLGRAAHGSFGSLWLDRTQTGADWCLYQRSIWREGGGRCQSLRAQVAYYYEDRGKHADIRTSFSRIYIQKQTRNICLQSDIYLMCFVAFAKC